MKCWHLFGSVHLWLAICLWGCSSAFAIEPTGAQNQENLATNLAQKIAQKSDRLFSGVNQNQDMLDKGASGEQTSGKIRQLSEIEVPLTSAKELVQSPAPNNPPASVPKQGGEIVQVTAVKANPTNKGVEIILQTSIGQQLQLVNRST